MFRNLYRSFTNTVPRRRYIDQPVQRLQSSPGRQLSLIHPRHWEGIPLWHRPGYHHTAHVKGSHGILDGKGQGNLGSTLKRTTDTPSSAGWGENLEGCKSTSEKQQEERREGQIQIQEEAKQKGKREKKANNDRDPESKWKLTAPKQTEPKQKVVEGKKYYWCPHHNDGKGKWVLHTLSESDGKSTQHTAKTATANEQHSTDGHRKVVVRRRRRPQTRNFYRKFALCSRWIQTFDTPTALGTFGDTSRRHPWWNL